MPGFWRRPVTRMYSYNLDVGENYYKPMSNYLDRNSSVERTARAETPGNIGVFADNNFKVMKSFLGIDYS